MKNNHNHKGFHSANEQMEKALWKKVFICKTPQDKNKFLALMDHLGMQFEESNFQDHGYAWSSYTIYMPDIASLRPIMAAAPEALLNKYKHIVPPPSWNMSSSHKEETKTSMTEAVKDKGMLDRVRNVINEISWFSVKGEICDSSRTVEVQEKSGELRKGAHIRYSFDDVKQRDAFMHKVQEYLSHNAKPTQARIFEIFNKEQGKYYANIEVLDPGLAETLESRLRQQNQPRSASVSTGGSKIPDGKQEEPRYQSFVERSDLSTKSNQASEKKGPGNSGYSPFGL